MYESFYGLSVKPFSLLPDAGFLFPSRRHRRAISLLEYAVAAQAGFTVISGDVGAGKTTIIRRFLKSLGPESAVGVITNPGLARGRLLDWILHAYELKAAACDDAALYDAFVDFLLAQYAQGRRAVLIIDEAQNLSAETLEELRMLSNVNNERDVLLQIILVGQPELLDRLKRQNLRQFVQRISAHCHLTPLTPAETAAYIRHRFTVAGGAGNVFDDMACAAVHYFTGGVPRLINLLCDQALVYGFAEDRRRISFELVAEAAVDRNSSGLGAFVNVPEILRLPQLRLDIKKILDDMRAAKMPDAAAE